MCVAPPSECQDVVDQVAPALRRPLYLVDILCQLRSATEVRFEYFRIAKNCTDDVIEVMRNPACQRSYDVHASRPFQSRRECDAIALEKLALNGVGNCVTGKPNNRLWENAVPSRVQGIEPHNSWQPAWSDQRHTDPTADAGRHERVLDTAWRQVGDIRHCDDIWSDCAELRGQS